MIRLHWVFAVKHNGQHKAQCVAGGHLTPPPVKSVYSGVVSMRDLRIVVFLLELNDLEVYGADVGNAYLKATTKEKVCFKAGPEFGDLKGHTMIILKALYGLKTSGKRWYEELADVLRKMGFKPTKAGECIWMRRVDDHYKYIGVFVDDLAVASKNPKGIIQTLKDDYGFKIKGEGQLEYHLGMEFIRDKDGTLGQGSKRYINKILE